MERGGGMGWRYTFDGGPEKGIETEHGHYEVVAMLAFAREGKCVLDLALRAPYSSRLETDASSHAGGANVPA